MARCFIAIELPEDVKNEVIEIQKVLQSRNLFEGKITEKENLHLTLKFLGDISESEIEEVRTRLKGIRLPIFKAELAEAGVFSESFVKIVWIKIDGKVADLQRDIDNALKDLFQPEFRFMSHMTIARVRRAKDRKKLIDYLNSLKIKRKGFLVKEFALKKSELFPEGPVYTDIERYKLKEQ